MFSSAKQVRGAELVPAWLGLASLAMMKHKGHKELNGSRPVQGSRPVRATSHAQSPVLSVSAS